MNLENKIIDCKQIANQLSEKIYLEAQDLISHGIHPTFATILVGENSASLIYVKNKQKKATHLNITNQLHHLSESISENDLLDIITALNQDPKIHGIIIQLPLPKHIDTLKIISQVSPKKDIDGLHPINIGYLATQNSKGFVPCTPLGCLHIIKTIKSDLSGKRAVIVGRSNLVGLPMAQLLINNNATVTVAHSKTLNLKEICQQADILVSAIGKANFINASYIKKEAIVIDVGISNIKINGASKIVGDIDIQSVLPIVSHITPVPKGVGLLTIIFLMSNVLKSTKEYNKFIL